LVYQRVTVYNVYIHRRNYLASSTNHRNAKRVVVEDLIEWFYITFERFGSTAFGLIVMTALLAWVLKTTHQERVDWRRTIDSIATSNNEALGMLQESNQRMQDRNIEAITEFKVDSKVLHTRQLEALEELTDAIRATNTKPARRGKKG